MPYISNRNKLFAALVILVVAFLFNYRQSVHHSPGILVPQTPIQTDFAQAPPSFTYNKYTITPLATYNIQARVLSIHTYWWDQMSDLGAIDFAVGWNKMSDTTNIEKLDITQGNRFFFYGWKDPPPLPVDEIVSSSANMHLIPATDSVKAQLKRVRTGEIINLKGQLIEAVKGGIRFRSSLVRTDTGAGACEIMWVTEVLKL